MSEEKQINRISKGQKYLYGEIKRRTKRLKSTSKHASARQHRKDTHEVGNPYFGAGSRKR